MQVVVGRIGRPHGVRGEVTVEVRTDAPERRFYPGAVLTINDGPGAELTVEGVRDHNGIMLVFFAEIADRTAAEQWRGTLLWVNPDTTTEPEEPEAWPVHHLIGLRAERADGTLLGTVTGLQPGPAQDLLIIRGAGRSSALVPFVTAIVPEVDVAQGRVVITPPEGLLDDLVVPRNAD